MKKIRGFKLNLRIKEVQRRAKKGKLDLAALSLDTDPALTALLDAFSARAKPSEMTLLPTTSSQVLMASRTVTPER